MIRYLGGGVSIAKKKKKQITSFKVTSQMLNTKKKYEI